MFESIEFLNRGWDVRMLESQSLRSVFLWSLMIAFLLGVDAVSVMWGFFSFHRLHWPIVMNLLLFTILGFRYSRIVYRRIGS
jgi:hypothetical protein